MVWELGLYFPARNLHPRATPVRLVQLLLPPQRCCGVAAALRVSVEAFWAETVPRAGRPRFRPGAILGLPGPRVLTHADGRRAFRDRTSPNPTPSRRTPLDCSRTPPGRPKRAARPPQIKKLLTGSQQRDQKTKTVYRTGARSAKYWRKVLRDAEHRPSNLERCGHAVRKNSS